jgi:hypothetical protein
MCPSADEKDLTHLSSSEFTCRILIPAFAQTGRAAAWLQPGQKRPVILYSEKLHIGEDEFLYAYANGPSMTSLAARARSSWCAVGPVRVGAGAGAGEDAGAGAGAAAAAELGPASG